MNYQKKQKLIIYNFCLLKIRATGNNIFITLTDSKHKPLIKVSAGIANFSGKKKQTPYVAEMVMRKLIFLYRKKNIKAKLIYIYNINIQSYVLSRCLYSLNSLNVKNLGGFIMKLTKAHNGMRAKKLKRT